MKIFKKMEVVEKRSWKGFVAKLQQADAPGLRAARDFFVELSSQEEKWHTKPEGKFEKRFSFLSNFSSSHKKKKRYGKSFQLID